MKFITVTYEDSLKFNSIIWNEYVAKIINISAIKEFLLILNNALIQSEIDIDESRQIEFNLINDINFFKSNFSDSMIYIKKLLNLFPENFLLKNNDSFMLMPTLASLKAIQYKFPFLDGTYSYFDVFNVDEKNMVKIYIDNIVIKSTNDKNIHQKNREFINNLLKN